MSLQIGDMAHEERSPSRTLKKTKKRKHTEETELATKKKKRKFSPLQVTNEHAAEDSSAIVKSRSKQKELQTPERSQAEALADMDVDLEHTPQLPDARAAPANGPSSLVTAKEERRKRKGANNKERTRLPEPELIANSDTELLDAPPRPRADLPAVVATLGDITSSTSIPHASATASPFHTTRISLYVSCPAVALSAALPSLISAHLTPLLLTYYPPLNGIVLSIHDGSISSRAAPQPSRPLLLPTTSNSVPLAQCADDAGASFIWLSAAFLILRPEKGAEMEGYINIASEGFIGLVLYNFFQVGIARTRIPWEWCWMGPCESGVQKQKKKIKKAKIKDAEGDDFEIEEASQESSGMITNSQATALNDDADASDNTGYWTRGDGSRVLEKEPLRFRVIDCDVVPTYARDREKWMLQIEGTLLGERDEAVATAEDLARFNRLEKNRHSRVGTPARDAIVNATMSGGLGTKEGSLGLSVVAGNGKTRHRVVY